MERNKFITTSIHEYFNNIDNITFKKSISEDTTKLEAYTNNKKIASLSMDVLFDAYHYDFEDVFDYETFNKLYPDNEIVKISYLDVDDIYRNSGIGTELMKRGMQLMKKNGYTQFFLNASPIGYNGLSTLDLVAFYKKFGFKELLNQGHNVLMGVNFSNSNNNNNNNINENVKPKRICNNVLCFNRMLTKRKFITTSINQYLEQHNLNSNSNIVAYHGTKSKIPFQKFESNMIGTGIVSQNSKKYDGFFFTTEKENAEFYSEYFICKTIINNVKPSPIENKTPTTVLSIGLINKQNYIIDDVLDGAVFSDIIIVPKNNLDTITILEWEFIGDQETIFEKWNELFGDDDGYVNTDMINDILEILNIDVNFLLNIPIFKQYYNNI